MRCPLSELKRGVGEGQRRLKSVAQSSLGAGKIVFVLYVTVYMILVNPILKSNLDTGISKTLLKVRITAFELA